MNDDNTPGTLIRDLEPDLRPREKAMRLGLDSLSDAELMALIFATGLRGKSVVQLSQEILNDHQGHMSRLMRLSQPWPWAWRRSAPRPRSRRQR